MEVANGIWKMIYSTASALQHSNYMLKKTLFDQASNDKVHKWNAENKIT